MSPIPLGVFLTIGGADGLEERSILLRPLVQVERLDVLHTLAPELITLAPELISETDCDDELLKTRGSGCSYFLSLPCLTIDVLLRDGSEDGNLGTLHTLSLPSLRLRAEGFFLPAVLDIDNIPEKDASI